MFALVYLLSCVVGGVTQYSVYTSTISFVNATDGQLFRQLWGYLANNGPGVKPRNRCQMGNPADDVCSIAFELYL